MQRICPKAHTRSCTSGKAALNSSPKTHREEKFCPAVLSERAMDLLISPVRVNPISHWPFSQVKGTVFLYLFTCAVESHRELPLCQAVCWWNKVNIALPLNQEEPALTWQRNPFLLWVRPAPSTDHTSHCHAPLSELAVIDAGFDLRQ